MSTPLNGNIFWFTQPDGTRFQVRAFGDQHYAIFETLDGYTLVQDPASGFFEVARLAATGSRLEAAPGPRGNLDGSRAAVPPGLRIGREAARAQAAEGARRLGGRRCDARREERKAQARAARSRGGPVAAPPQRHTVGDFVGLCLLIDFPDQPATLDAGEIERFCNQPGYRGFGNQGSVLDYFHDNSLGRCRYTNIVAPYYRARRPRSYYTDRSVQMGVRARELILEALADLKARHFDFSRLTADGGGFVYALNVFYAGPVVNNWMEGLWPHSWSLAAREGLAPGKDAYDYQFTAMGDELSLGTFCHENGHMLCDYPDLYDYGYESSGVGGYCLMCAGANLDPKNPTQISAYLKRMSGWAGQVLALQHDQSVELTAGHNDFAILAKDSSEYFLFEYRRQDGRDASLPAQGLAIWHVDEGGDNSQEQGTPAQHYELSLEQADGLFHLERSRGHMGDAGDLYGPATRRFGDNTTPSSRWWDGTASNLEIHPVQMDAQGASIRFHTRLVAAGGDAQTIQGQSAPGLGIPDNRAGGVTDTIAIAQEGRIASAQVTLDIRHPYVGDLRVTLLTPWGDSIRLHDRRGGAADIRRTLDEGSLPGLAALRGRSARGDWRLHLEDLAAADTGTLQGWALAFTTAGPNPAEVILEETPGTHIPDASAAGIHRGLTTVAAGTLGSLEVTVDISHSYIGDLRVSLLSPAGDELLLHDQTGGSADHLFQTYSQATTPALGALAGQPLAGTWRLKVADRAAVDVGKLNRWKLLLRPAP